MKSKIRVRLRFDIPPPSTTAAAVKCFMFLINKDDMQFISDMEHSVARKFGFSTSRVLSLSIDGYMLLPGDDIEVIRDGDEVCVGINDYPPSDDNVKHPCGADKKEVKKSKSKKRLHSPNRIDDSLASSQKRLKRSRDGVQDKTKDKKTKKCKSSKSKHQPQSRVDTSQSRKVLKRKKTSKDRKHSKKTNHNSAKKNAQCVDQVSTNVTDFIASLNRLGTAQRNENASGLASPTSFSSPKTGLSSRLQGENLHVTSDKENLQLIPKKKNSPTKRKTPLKSKSSHKENQKDAAPSPEFTNPPIKKSDIYHNTSYITRCPPGSGNNEATASLSTSLVKDYSALKTISWPPRNGDLIAFKLLEMTDDYTPAISDFMEARVMNVEGDASASSSLTIDVLWPPVSSKPKQAGKFDLIYDDDDEVPPVQDNPRLVSWTCLLEPKLIENT